MELRAEAPSRPAAGVALRAQLTGLRRWNGPMDALHLAQGLAMLALANAFSLTVTSSFLRVDAATDKPVAVPDGSSTCASRRSSRRSCSCPRSRTSRSPRLGYAGRTSFR